ncbi:hypothetical protein, partial [Pseudomonas aeruginosa]
LAGLLALAGVLGVGEGHLLHRKALRVKSADFAKSGSLFQSFPNSTQTGSSPLLGGDLSDLIKNWKSPWTHIQKGSQLYSTSECMLHKAGSSTSCAKAWLMSLAMQDSVSSSM